MGPSHGRRAGALDSNGACGVVWRVCVIWPGVAARDHDGDDHRHDLGGEARALVGQVPQPTGHVGRLLVEAIRRGVCGSGKPASRPITNVKSMPVPRRDVGTTDPVWSY